MGKVAYFALGTAGAGGLGAGGVTLYNKLGQAEESKATSIVTLKDKYSQAILNASDTGIWDKKYEALKTASPSNSKLRDAVNKAKLSNPDKNGALELLKSGCEEVYLVQADDASGLSDFKSLCSKTNENVTSSTGSFITDQVSGNSDKWDKSLTSLKDHTGELDDVLKKLKEGIQSSQSTFPQDKKTELKNWCDAARASIFEGSNSVKFKNQETFCKSST
ncbi:hypothetical protein HF1_04630 [Mycoplasma haemofelis str. Langford 1]|uniref:Uncharacterized protein n=1 Tax=Mycoplasma haemofelis (strain Langford 1) TaxID=941640 RepID=E8ZH50_MYCHL|nr:hypothetical protein [Mycoplasma haemofelis]CBY92471.1 hypothetical protein HF1_04630 [Mycoplasma haemofelis str. Langford 1]